MSAGRWGIFCRHQDTSVEWPHHALRDRSTSSFKRALDLIVTKQIDVSPLISHAFSLDQIEQAMDYATTCKDNARKVCVKF